MFDYTSIKKYHKDLKEGRTSCEIAVTHYLGQIDSHNHLNAFIHVYAEEALNRARELDKLSSNGSPMLPLHGVVIGIKDVIAYRGHPLTAASNILRANKAVAESKDFISLYNATAVERLLRAGAIIIGSLNCDEFAMGSANEHSAYGKVFNPVHKDHVPGGSSGGSASAVAAGLCMVSLGSDTGGSVRQPADFCGIIGFKPSYGTVSRYGLVAYASSFDQIGIFGKTVSDVSLLLDVMAGPDEYDSTVSAHPLPKADPKAKYKIAWFPEALNHPSLDPEIGKSIVTLLDQLKGLGHHVEPVSFDLLDYVVPAYYVLTTAEASSNLSRYDGVRYGYRSAVENDLAAMYTLSRSEGFGKEVKRRIMLGNFVLSAGHYDAYFTRAQKVRKLLKEKTQLVFREFDFIILPNSPTTAPRFGQVSDPVSIYLADLYTVMANLTGIPAISLPLFWHNNGLPFGLQMMAERFNEVSLLHFSEMLMQTRTEQV